MPSPELPLYIDSTQRSCFISCPERFRKEFVLGLRPVAVSIDLHAGACFASALEHIRKSVWLSGASLNDALPSAHRNFLVEWGDVVPLKETPKTRENVWAAIESYFDHYGTHTDPVQPYFAEGHPTFEFTFAIPLEPAYEPREAEKRGIHAANYSMEMPSEAQGFPLHPSGSPFIYCGRFDLLGSYHTRPCILDDKTTTSIGNAWHRKWNLRGQYIGYVWACQQLGLDIDTVITRGVGILKTKTSHAEAIKQYSSFLVARWLEQLRRDLWALRRAWDEGYFDYRFGDACESYGGCAFMDLCGSANETSYYEQYIVKRWNPLARNPIEEKLNA